MSYYTCRPNIACIRYTHHFNLMKYVRSYVRFATSNAPYSLVADVI